MIEEAEITYRKVADGVPKRLWKTLCFSGRLFNSLVKDLEYNRLGVLRVRQAQFNDDGIKK